MLALSATHDKLHGGPEAMKLPINLNTPHRGCSVCWTGNLPISIGLAKVLSLDAPGVAVKDRKIKLLQLLFKHAKKDWKNAETQRELVFSQQVVVLADAELLVFFL